MNHPYPAPTVRENIAAIDPAWIDQVLSRAGVCASRVASLRAEPVGHGTASSVFRLSLAYTDEPSTAPRTLIAKLPKVSSSGEAPDAALLGYEREVAAYHFFGLKPPCRMPACYFAAIRTDGVFNLILEELDEGCWPGDQIAGCSIDEAGAAVRTLATLHGAYDPVTLTGLTWPKRRQHFARQSAAMFARGAAIMRERYADELGGAALATIDGVAPLVGPWSAQTAALERLIHTAARDDKLIFEHAAGGLRACLIDLQTMAIGDPAYDVAYFLSGSLEPAERAACERDLIAQHADLLRSSGVEEAAVSAWDNYRRHAIAGMVATVNAASVLAPTPAIDRLLTTLARRNCAAVQELGGIEAAKDYLR